MIIINESNPITTYRENRDRKRRKEKKAQLDREMIATYGPAPQRTKDPIKKGMKYGAALGVASNVATGRGGLVKGAVLGGMAGFGKKMYDDIAEQRYKNKISKFKAATAYDTL